MSICFRVPDPGSGAHHLYIARAGLAVISKIVLMRDRSLTYVGDDFNVFMWMEWEALARRNLIIVPNVEIADRPMLGVAVGADRKMVQSFKPAIIASAECRARTMFNHAETP